MNKILLTWVAIVGILSTSVMADALKNNLSNMMHKKDTTPGMVDLSRLNVDAKPQRRQQPKTRSSKAVVATVNGQKVIKKQANAYLSKRTKGKVKDFDLLPKKQKHRLLQEMFLSSIAAGVAKKELTTQEKVGIYTRVWMQKEMKKTQVTDEQVKEAYDTLKQRSAQNPNAKPIPEFNKIKNNMKMQMSEKVIMEKLAQNAKIKVIDANMIAGSINDEYISIDDINIALNSISKGKATWSTIPPADKERVLKMVAPSKLIEKKASKTLTSKEKNTALTNFWMQNKIMKTKVSDKELHAAYNKIKKAAKKAKSKKKIPEFEQLKETLHIQIGKEKVLANLMNYANIKLK
jgi:tellurite resistance protein